MGRSHCAQLLRTEKLAFIGGAALDHCVLRVSIQVLNQKFSGVPGVTYLETSLSMSKAEASVVVFSVLVASTTTVTPVVIL